MVRRAVFLCLVLVLPAGARPLAAQQLHFEATALNWERTNNSQHLDFFTSPTDRLDPAQDLNFGNEWGQRFRLFWEGDRWDIEGSYTRLDDWSAAASGFLGELSFDLDAGGAQTPLGIVTGIGQAAVQEEEALGATRINTAEHLDPGASFSAVYLSQWNDAELNLKKIMGTGRWLKAGFGVRYGNLDELFNLSITGTLDDTPLGDNNTEELTHASLTNTGPAAGNVNDTVVGGGLTLVSGGATGFQGDVVAGNPDTASILDIDFDADVQNELVGAQMIFQALFWDGDLLTLEGIVKGGVFHNNVKVALTETYREVNLDLSTYQRSFTDSKDAVAFLGNVGLAAGLKLRENVRLKFGYEVQFLTGVALAAEQWHQVRADSFGRPSFEADATGTVISHGGNGALEVIW